MQDDLAKPHQNRTRWGGIDDRRFEASGFFRVAKRGDIWWFVDPDGGRFLSKGVDTVRTDQDRIQNSARVPYAESCRRKYGRQQAWREAAARRLLSYGFNSLGAWSDVGVAAAGASPLAVAPVIDIGGAFLKKSPGGNAARAFPDVFDPAFEAFARRHAHRCCAAFADDASVLGWFSDNELRWGPDWRGHEELLQIFLDLRPASAGRRAAVDFLRQRYACFDRLRNNWRLEARSWDELADVAKLKPERGDREAATFFADCDAFAGHAAKRYFEVTAGAIKTADPNHLVLGCRFALVPRPPVIAAAGDRLDVISFNCYDPDPARVIEAYAVGGRPCLVGEFSFRGDDAGLPNTIGAAPRTPTQAARADGFERYATAGLAHPSLVGYHWFEHADQPAEGRFDGENSNYGIVNIEDDPYVDLTKRMTDVNTRAEQIHAASTVAGKADKRIPT